MRSLRCGPIAPIALCVCALTIGCTGQDGSARPVARTLPDILLRAETQIIQSTVPRRATLDSLLRDTTLRSDLVDAAVRSAAGVFNVRHLRAERPYKLVLSLDGLLREFIYEIDADRFLRIAARDFAKPQALEAAVLPFEKETAVVAVRGRIDEQHSSLVAAVDGAGENIQLAMVLADMFGGQIDFNNDLQPGDAFEVLFEKSTREGQFAGYGAILGARFAADGKEHQAFRWVNPETGKPGYYDENGRSLKRFFLMSPLGYEPRITSRFSRRRLHPVHRSYRAHLGVDYGAPHGARVVAVAAGTVVSAGWAGGGGRQVRIRHAGGFETYYLHLSSFANGIRAGARVDQGQLIGRVGSSGTATGPHLDFRLRRNGVFVDPVRERRRQPPGEPIPAKHAALFGESRDAILGQLSASAPADARPARPDAVKANQ
jgi:murein DD-endopeptidase MepM/ murein hydrolase activator NlpD